MSSDSVDILRYPIGPRPPIQLALDHNVRANRVDSLAKAPASLCVAVADLSPAQLDSAHRPGGWTVRQIVHHLADSHLIAYTRIRIALTEPQVAVMGFEPGEWAELADARTGPVHTSLALFQAAHERLDFLLRAIPESDFARRIEHPYLGAMSVDAMIDTYAWHARHHTTQISAFRQREGR